MKSWRRILAAFALAAAPGGEARTIPEECPVAPPEVLGLRLLLKGADAAAGWRDEVFAFGAPGSTNEVRARVPAAALSLRGFYRFTEQERRIRGLLGVELNAPLPRGAGGEMEVRPARPFRGYDVVTAREGTFGGRVGKVMANVRFLTEEDARDEAAATATELLACMPLSPPETVVKDRMWIMQTRRIAIVLAVMPVADEWTAGICMADKCRNALHLSLSDPGRFDPDGDGGDFPYTGIVARDTRMRTAEEVETFFRLKGRDAGTGDDTYTYKSAGSGVPDSKLPRVSLQLLEDYPLTETEETLAGYFGAEAAIGGMLPKNARPMGRNLLTVVPERPLWPFGPIQVHTNGLGRIDVATGAAGPMRRQEAMALAGRVKAHFLLTCEMKPECVSHGRRWLFQARRLAFVMTLAQNPQSGDVWGLTLTLHDKAGFGLK